MKKMPTLFQREFDRHRVVNITDQLTSPKLVWVLSGEGIATEKIDGACCALIGGQFYKRYDAKKNKQGILKQPPVSAIPCDVPDPVTEHWPHWVPVDEANAADQWFIAAKAKTPAELTDGTYEAIGPHFNGNPHQLEQDMLVRHGEKIIQLENRSFEGIRTYLEQHCIEGIVFWKDGILGCKIKRRDFGFMWPETKAISHDSEKEV